MGQLTWTYVDDDGFSHKVGLYHGDKTGHLMVYCNTRIVVIDFGVQSSKNYTFFIDEELCDIAIEENEGAFSYSFTIDQKTDTPRNRGRRKMLKSQLKQSLLLGVAFVAAISIVVFLVMNFL